MRANHSLLTILIGFSLAISARAVETTLTPDETRQFATAKTR
jgi:hypothetical protein